MAKFKKGKSGNPSDRPKGSRHRAAALAESRRRKVNGYTRKRLNA